MSLTAELDTIKNRILHLAKLNSQFFYLTPNQQLFEYWKFYDQFGDVTLNPNEITNYHSIDRAIRILTPEHLKKRSREKEYHDHFSQP